METKNPNSFAWSWIGSLDTLFKCSQINSVIFPQKFQKVTELAKTPWPTSPAAWRARPSWGASPTSIADTSTSGPTAAPRTRSTASTSRADYATAAALRAHNNNSNNRGDDKSNNSSSVKASPGKRRQTSPWESLKRTWRQIWVEMFENHREDKLQLLL